SWSTHHFYHADGGGNVTYMVDGGQAMVATYRYDPFGNTISSSGTQASANVYRFSSKEIYVNTGIYYYGYRFYDPNLQRWLNRDPLADVGFKFVRALPVPRVFGESNLYTFVMNDGVNNIDSYGLLECGLRHGRNCDAEKIACAINGGIICGTFCALMGEGPWCLVPCGVTYAAICAQQYDDCIHGR